MLSKVRIQLIVRLLIKPEMKKHTNTGERNPNRSPYIGLLTALSVAMMLQYSTRTGFVSANGLNTHSIGSEKTQKQRAMLPQSSTMRWYFVATNDPF